VEERGYGGKKMDLCRDRGKDEWKGLEGFAVVLSILLSLPLVS